MHHGNENIQTLKRKRPRPIQFTHKLLKEIDSIDVCSHVYLNEINGAIEAEIVPFNRSPSESFIEPIACLGPYRSDQAHQFTKDLLSFTARLINKMSDDSKVESSRGVKRG